MARICPPLSPRRFNSIVKPVPTNEDEIDAELAILQARLLDLDAELDEIRDYEADAVGRKQQARREYGSRAGCWIVADGWSGMGGARAWRCPPHLVLSLCSRVPWVSLFPVPPANTTGVSPFAAPAPPADPCARCPRHPLSRRVDHVLTVAGLGAGCATPQDQTLRGAPALHGWGQAWGRARGGGGGSKEREQEKRRSGCGRCMKAGRLEVGRQKQGTEAERGDDAHLWGTRNPLGRRRCRCALFACLLVTRAVALSPSPLPPGS